MQIRSQLSQMRCFSGFFIPGKKNNKRSVHYQRLNEKNIVKCLSLVKKKKDSCFTNKIFRNSTVHFSVSLCYLNFKLMKVYRCAVGWYPIINLFFLLFFPVV